MLSFKRALRAAAAAQALLLLAAGSTLAAPPVEAFGVLPAIADVHLSPDGTHFSAIEPVNGRPAILVFQLHPPPGTKPQVYALKDGDAGGSYWVNSDRLICFFYQNKYHDESNGVNLRTFSRAVSVSISNKTPPFMLMDGSRVYAQSGGQNIGLQGRSVDDPSILFMSAWRYYGAGDPDTRLGNGRARLELFSVNVDNNHVETLAQGEKDTVGWVLDEHGHMVGRFDSTDSSELPKSTDTFLALDGKNWRTAATYDNASGPLATIQGLSLDGNSLVIRKYGSQDKKYLESLPVKAGTAVSELFSNPSYDVDGVISDPWTGRVVGAHYMDDKLQSTYFDPQLAHIQKRMEAALSGQTVVLSSWNEKRDTFLVTAEDPHNPPGVYLFTTADSHLEYLMSAYPSLQPSDLGDVKPYPYKARDGLDLHAYLTLPPGKTPKNLPTVIFPHGGPETRDFVGFDWWAQFMASRGYAVLQTNFRGSTGYGASFRDAGFGQWGRKMQDDISDGVTKLIADGIADPKRICIVGASYGGYAALAGATFTPSVYACAVSYAGIADVSSILGEARGAGADSSPMHYWEDRLGATYADSKSLRAISPAVYADQVRAPILLLHSNTDTVVPVTQSMREENALTAAGKKVRFVKLEGSDHDLDHSDVRLAVLREIEAFLAANIGN
jgi:dipeptidyl aminopeptidase/acylaminoacyl peptidase